MKKYFLISILLLSGCSSSSQIAAQSSECHDTALYCKCQKDSREGYEDGCYSGEHAVHAIGTKVLFRKNLKKYKTSVCYGSSWAEGYKECFNGDDLILPDMRVR
jgi:hypothetical protein